MASDDFTDSDDVGLETHDSNWISFNGHNPTGLEIKSNKVQREAVWGGAHGAVYSNGQSEDQSSEITIEDFSASYPGAKHVVVRGNTSTDGYSFELVETTGNYTAINWYSGATYKGGDGTFSFANTLAIKIKAQAATNGADVDLNVWVNDVLELTQTDTTTQIFNGLPGFYENSINVIAAWDDWTDGINGTSPLVLYTSPGLSVTNP